MDTLERAFTGTIIHYTSYNVHTLYIQCTFYIRIFVHFTLYFDILHQVTKVTCENPSLITTNIKNETLCRKMWDFPDRNTYDEEAPLFSAARDNENWGHCELDFVDTKTAKVIAKLRFTER